MHTQPLLCTLLCTLHVQAALVRTVPALVKCAEVELPNSTSVRSLFTAIIRNVSTGDGIEVCVSMCVPESGAFASSILINVHCGAHTFATAYRMRCGLLRRFAYTISADASFWCVLQLSHSADRYMACARSCPCVDRACPGCPHACCAMHHALHVGGNIPIRRIERAGGAEEHRLRSTTEGTDPHPLTVPVWGR
jgi:hypothetical protein